MASLEQTANNYCSLAYGGLFYQNGSAASCAAMKTQPMSPIEYITHPDTIKLRQDFSKGLKPEKCINCWDKEERGHRSMRSYSQKERDPSKITHMELRESNLCNYGCRMCDRSSSSVIEREMDINPQLEKYYNRDFNSSMLDENIAADTDNSPTTDKNWNEILRLANGLESLILTGGEPMLMKRYYDLLDYLVVIGKQNIKLIMYTNGSVYNPIIVDKLKNFPNLILKFSIDGVGKVGEYQRHKSDWETVSSNLLQFSELPLTIKIHTTITAYNILDISSLAKYLVSLQLPHFNNAATISDATTNVASHPRNLEFLNLNVPLKIRAIQEINKAVKLMEGYKFLASYSNDLMAVQNRLVETKHEEIKFRNFVEMTRALDKARNERFEDVFGYKLY